MFVNRFASRKQPSEDEFAERRARMVETQLVPRGIHDQRVLAAMGRLPRERFVPPAFQEAAYNDAPLPIGWGQTISQPLMVAVMLQAAELTGRERVLEVGTGSGYQAALLGLLAREVYTLEVVAPLAERARGALLEVGSSNVTVVDADGSCGFATAAPYDAILVAAAAPRVPEPLLQQLSDTGRLIIPVGVGMQVLERIRRRGDGIEREQLDLCGFVPLVGRYGVGAGA